MEGTQLKQLNPAKLLITRTNAMEVKKIIVAERA